MEGGHPVQRAAPALAAVLSIAAIHWLSRPELLVGHRRVIVLCLLVGAALILVGLPGIGCAVLLQNRSTSALLLGAVVVGSGLAGWLLFWAALAGYEPIASELIVAGFAAVLAVCPMDRRTAMSLAMPMLVTSLVGVGYIAIAGNQGALDRGNNMVAYRYWVVLDNELPEIFAVKLLDDRASLRPYIVGDWQASDRPPLQTGMMLTGYPFAARANRALIGLLLAVAVNLTWIVGLWSLLRAVGVADRLTGAVVFAVALAGTVFVNTVYAWPKLLAGSLVLVAAAAVLDRSAHPCVRVGLAGAAAALALLSHGAAAFGLAAVLPVLWTQRRGLKWRHVAAGAGVAAAVYAPWIGFQHFYAPPGDRLVKWHLAGTDIDRPDPGSPLRSIVGAYREAGPGRVVAYRLSNARLLLGDPTPWLAHMGHWTPGWDASGLGRIREFLLTSLAPAPGVLLLGLPLMLFRRVRRASWWAPVTILAGFSALAYAALEWGGRWQATAWLHTGPYSLLLLWCVVGALAAGEFSRRLLIALTVGQAVLFVGIWVHGVTLQSAYTSANPGHTDHLLDFLAGVAFAILAVTLSSRFNGRLIVGWVVRHGIWR
jgi:hypothetical protein